MRRMSARSRQLVLLVFTAVVVVTLFRNRRPTSDHTADETRRHAASRRVLVEKTSVTRRQKMTLRPVARRSTTLPPSGAAVFQASRFRRLTDHVHLYSAFMDERDGNIGRRMVRLIALVERRQQLECVFDGAGVAAVEFYEMAENHGLSVRVFTLSCALPANQSSIGLASVALRTAGSSTTVEVPIVRSLVDPPTTRCQFDYTICAPVLYGTRYGAAHLVEFFELNKLLGAAHVFLYADTTTLRPDTRRVLRYYENSKYLTLLNFVLPVQDESIWYHGQLVAVADCLQRNAGLSELVGFHDLDEFIVPYAAEAVQHALAPLFAEQPALAAVCLRAELFVVASPPMTLRSGRAADELEQTYVKCVVVPERVFEQGIHHVSRVVQDSYEVAKVEPQVVRLHHYKLRPNSEDGLRHNDRIARLYGAPLQQRFDAVVKQLRVTDHN